MANERKIKATLALDGEAAFKKSMNEAYSAMKVLGSEMKLNTARFGENATSMEGLTKRGDILQRQIAAEKDAVAKLTDQLAKAKDAYGETDKRTQDYQVSLNKASAYLAQYERQLRENDTAIENYGKETVEADGKTDRFGKAVSTAGNKADTMRKSIVSLGGSMKNGLSAATVAAGQLMANFAQQLISTLGNVAKAGLTYNQDIESYTTNFGVMLGSMESGAAKVEELRAMAAKTPFALSDLASATQTLISFQIPAKDTQKVLKQLGDIALGDKAKLAGLATVFGQVSSAGKLQGQDLMQMINQGFNPLNYIAKRTGESMEVLRARMAKGKVTAKEVAQAISDATSEGQMFYNGMEQASKTVTGLLSTLKDDTTALIGQVLTPMTNWLRDDLLPRVDGYVTGISEAMESGTADMRVVIGDILGEIIADTDSKLQEFVPKVAAFLTDAMDVLIGQAPAMLEMGSALLANLVDGMGSVVPRLAEFAGQIAPLVIETIITFKSSIFSAGVEILTGILNGLAAKPEKIVETITTAVASMITTITNNLPSILDSGVKILLAVIQGIVDSIPMIAENMPKIIDQIETTLENNWPAIKQAGKDMMSALWDGMKSLFGYISKNLGAWLYNLFADENSKVTVDLNGGIYNKYIFNPRTGKYEEGRANGMDYVPYNDYRARLHEGEAVLTKIEAARWRNGNGETQTGETKIIYLQPTIMANELDYASIINAQYRSLEMSARQLA